MNPPAHQDHCSEWSNLACDCGAQNEYVAELCERLRALVIMDEVGADNPLARDAADCIESLSAELAREQQEHALHEQHRRQTCHENDRLLATTIRLRERNAELEKALRELIECENLKECIEESDDPMNWKSSPELPALQAEYDSRKPAAWVAARIAAQGAK